MIFFGPFWRLFRSWLFCVRFTAPHFFVVLFGVIFGPTVTATRTYTYTMMLTATAYCTFTEQKYYRRTAIYIIVIYSVIAIGVDSTVTRCTFKAPKTTVSREVLGRVVQYYILYIYIYDWE